MQKVKTCRFDNITQIDFIYEKNYTKPHNCLITIDIALKNCVEPFNYKCTQNDAFSAKRAI